MGREGPAGEQGKEFPSSRRGKGLSTEGVLASWRVSKVSPLGRQPGTAGHRSSGHAFGAGSVAAGRDTLLEDPDPRLSLRELSA